MLLGFKKRFAPPIVIGTKVFTMRKTRKVKAKIGETLHMYTGLRTANCELISNKEKLMSTQRAWVRFCYFYNKKGLHLADLSICVDGRRLEKWEHEAFVKYDGFEDVADFFKYWLADYKHTQFANYKLAKSMDLYHWTDLRI